MPHEVRPTRQRRTSHRANPCGSGSQRCGNLWLCLFVVALKKTWFSVKIKWHDVLPQVYVVFEWLWFQPESIQWGNVLHTYSFDLAIPGLGLRSQTRGAQGRRATGARGARRARGASVGLGTWSASGATCVASGWGGKELWQHPLGLLGIMAGKSAPYLMDFPWFSHYLHLVGGHFPVLCLIIER